MARPPDSFDWFGQFGIDDLVIRRVLAEATAHGADDADVYFEHRTSTAVGMSDRKVNRAHTSIDLGMGVRVVVGEQVGYAYTEDLSPESLRHAARTAAAIARTGRATEPVALVRQSLPDYYPVARRGAEVDIQARIPLLRQWEERAFAADPRVRKVQVSISDTDCQVLVARCDGTVAADYRPMVRGSVSCTAVDGGVSESGSQGLAARSDLSFFDADRGERMVATAVGRALRALRASSPPAGEMAVVMAPGSSGILLHEAIGHGMEADFNRKGISVFADRIGTRIAPAEVTIRDDATLPGCRGSLNVDDEASPTENTVLVRDGVLVSYLHDRISARHYGVAPTGNGRRESFRSPVLPRMRTTYMDAGPHDPDEIVASVDNGIYCEVFQNGAVQIGAGDFSFYVRLGRLIEGGRLTRDIKDVNLIGSGPEVLATIDMVGNDLVIDEAGWTCGKDGQSVPVSQGMPTVKVAKLSVGGGRP